MYINFDEIKIRGLIDRGYFEIEIWYVVYRIVFVKVKEVSFISVIFDVFNIFLKN